ncbi:hypothetical protein MASR2M8_19760 [Opitutaceae bacterium]
MEACPNAETTPHCLRKNVMAVLAEMGLEHRTDERSDIVFRYSDATFYVIFSPDDGDYLRLVYPWFWEPDDEHDLPLALKAANIANQRIKVIKIILIGCKALAVAENYIADISVLRKRLPQFLELMFTACDEFMAEFDRMHEPEGESSSD